MWQLYTWPRPSESGLTPCKYFERLDGQFFVWDRVKWTPVALHAIARDFQAFTRHVFVHLASTDMFIQMDCPEEWFEQVVRASIRSEVDRLCSPGRYSWLLDGRALLPCANGLLDVNERALATNPHQFFNLEHNEIAYDPEASCPRFEQLLHKVCPDAESARVLQRLASDVVAGRGTETIYALLGENNRVKRLIARVIGSLVPEDTVWSNAVQPNGAYRRLGKRERVLLSIVDSAVESAGTRKSIRRSLASRLRSMQRGTRDPLETTVILSESLPDIAEPARLAGLEIHAITPGGAAEVYANDLWGDLQSELPGILNWALSGA